MELLKAVGAIVASVFAGAILVWWLVIVANRIGVKPTVENGNVTLDEYQRAKDILLVVFPLFSASLAYWVGSSGTRDAKQEATDAKKQLNAVVDASPEGVLDKARQLHPDAFAS
jgi:hypothetical protein